MKRRAVMVVVLAGMLLTAGCKSMFSHSESSTVSHWQSYHEVNADFEKIVPNRTTVDDLRLLGFHPLVSPNVKILSYVDIVQTFMSNPAIHTKDLPDPVRACIAAKENSQAYLVELRDIRDRRHGNLFLDVFGFKRRTHESGWEFKGLILIKGNVVMYKLASGEPQISREDTKTKPLGPLQELDGSFSAAVGYVK